MVASVTKGGTQKLPCSTDIWFGTESVRILTICVASSHLLQLSIGSGHENLNQGLLISPQTLQSTNTFFISFKEIQLTVKSHRLIISDLKVQHFNPVFRMERISGVMARVPNQAPARVWMEGAISVAKKSPNSIFKAPIENGSQLITRRWYSSHLHAPNATKTRISSHLMSNSQPRRYPNRL
jgi:hypothetical protein